MKLVKRIINKLSRERLIKRRKSEAQKLGIDFYEPNYIFKGTFDSKSVVIDVGCADDADFSLFMIKKFSSKCYGVDPTRKHSKSLQSLEKVHQGKFVHIPFAVSSDSGYIQFHESDHFTSGSLDSDHLNMKRDKSISYDVKTITLPELLDHIKIKSVDFIKLDLEGAEYQLVNALKKNDLRGYNQIFIEFHHHSFEKYTKQDTFDSVKILEGLGFYSFSVDNHNYLFYR